MMESFFNIANLYRYHLRVVLNMLFKFINQVALLGSLKCQDMRQLFAKEVCRRRSLFMAQLFVLVFRI